MGANYFDGRSTRVRQVSLVIDGRDLIVSGEDVAVRVPFASVKVDERLGRAPRRLRLPDGSFCEARDLEALDALLISAGYRDGRVDRLQRHVKFALLACIASVALVVVAYRTLLPWAAARAARHLPPSAGKILTAQTLSTLDGRILLPSKLAPDRQNALSAQFHALLLPEGGHPRSPLLFRSAPELGPNAFTLPDGTIVMLDELVTSINDDPQLMAVVAHELGHAHGYHGLQLLLRSTAVGAFLSLYIGDMSQLLAAAPAALLQARYSQDLEREADDYGADLLIRNGMSPELLAEVLRKLTRARPGGATGGYLASHPSTQERIRHLHVLTESH